MELIKDKSLSKEEFEDWLKGAVSDIFMDLFYYDRKGCEDMPTELLNYCEKKGFITKELLISVFTKQIESEFEQKI